MKERIKRYMDYKSISAGELSSLLEVQRSNISHILNGRNKPGAAFIERLLISFPDLNARWLFTGDGEMTLNNAAPKAEQIVINHSKTEKIESKEPIEKLAESLSTNRIAVDNDKEIERVVLLYTDGTFTDFNRR